MTYKEEFISLFTTHITRPGSDKLLQWLEASDFFEAPASTRFHGSHPGGLLEHSLNVYRALKTQLSAVELSDVEYSDETIAIVSLLHDLCKVNMYKPCKKNVKVDGRWVEKDSYEYDEEFLCGHSEKSVIMLQNFIRLTRDEIYAIRAHMGGFDTSVKGGDRFIGEIFERCPLAVLVHMADMTATYIMETRD